MTTYNVMIGVNIHPMATDGPDFNSGNSLYHSQQFKISGDKFSDVAPTIDGIYAAIQQVVEANGGHGN